MNAQDHAVLTVPGLWNSGPLHWQTAWEGQHPSWRRVIQKDWEHPARDEWVATLEEAVRSCTTPPILAAHSLGCALVAHWAESGGSPIRGALLVAPSDVEAPSYPEETTGFAPMSLLTLPFPSVVIASTNDEYVSVERALFFAQSWGSRLVFLENAGHINGAAGYGPWPEGESMLLDWLGETEPPGDGPRE